MRKEKKAIKCRRIKKQILTGFASTTKRFDGAARLRIRFVA
jgi:hypothetical protein